MQKKKCIVGIDFGTTSLSAVILDINSTKIEKIYSYNTEAYINFEDNYRKEQSIEKIASLFNQIIDQINNLPDIEPLAFSFTGQMHGIIGLDECGKAVTNLVTWQDKSGDIIGKDGISLVEEIHNITNCKTIVNGYGIVTLYKWIKHEQRKDIKSFCTVSDYFALLLATKNGNLKINNTMAHSIGLYDIKTNTWQYELIEKLGLSDITFPEIVDNKDQIIGSVNNIPVVCSIGDNQASFLSSVINPEQTILLNVGTGTQLSFLIDKADLPKYQNYIDGFETQLRPYNTNHFLIATSFLNGGSVYKSLFNFFKDVAQNLFGISDIDEASLWKQMMLLAKQPASQNTPLEVSPLLEGNRKNPTLGGSISDLHSSNFTAGHFISGFLRGLAQYYKTGFLTESEERVNYISGSGNGLKRNTLFCKIIESTFNLPLRLTTFNEEAAVGAAIYGGIVVGLLDQKDYALYLENLSQ